MTAQRTLTKDELIEIINNTFSDADLRYKNIATLFSVEDEDENVTNEVIILNRRMVR